MNQDAKGKQVNIPIPSFWNERFTPLKRNGNARNHHIHQQEITEEISFLRNRLSMKIEENLCLEIHQEEKKKGIWKSSL